MKTKGLNAIDKQYYNKLHKERKYSDILLLVELLAQTYYYSGNYYNNVNVSDLIKEIEQKENYTNHEKDLMTQNAIKILKIKYNINIYSTKPLIFENKIVL